MVPVTLCSMLEVIIIINISAADLFPFWLCRNYMAHLASWRYCMNLTSLGL